jgi:ferrochelatase
MIERSPLGVLVMAYGSPEDPEDEGQLEQYLHHILNEYAPPGKTVERVPPPAIADLKRRYELIGSGSPLVEITRRQARALEAWINSTGGVGGRSVRAAVGMKHFRPWIADGVAELAAARLHDAVALVMAPHYSKISVGGYHRAVREANEKLEKPLRVRFVDSWHTEPKFIDVLVARVQVELDRAGWPLVDTTIIFSAHSLPARILEWKDPYPKQLEETAKLVARGLGSESWTVAYQSEGRGHEPWLGPSVAKTIERLAGEGVTRILVCPVGFVADHLEILYDLDIECANVAKETRVELRRTASLNDDPAFIDAVADVVRRAASG